MNVFTINVPNERHGSFCTCESGTPYGMYDISLFQDHKSHFKAVVINIW